MENTHWVRGTCIGRGAFGTVNLGINLSNGDIFAVKSVNSSSCLPSQLQALENEIRILKTISSPYIVQYLGDDTTTTTFRNLHLEYLPRGTTADVAYDEETVRSYTWCLLSALSYLHSRGITHCDVKGKNVLLGPSPGSAKLADFGSAIENPIIGGGSTRGSPLWMAPEVIRGEYQGPESDVWSLGCTVIEMLTGKPGWEVNFRRIGWSDELPLLPARLSNSGRDFLEKCFRRDYEKRWSCDQLLKHPFISANSRKDLIVYSSPRCVLDGFNLNFDEGGSDVEELDTNLNLDAEQRIRRLVSGVRVNWETSDGWVVVREREVGADLEYFNLGERPVVNMEMYCNTSTSLSLSEEQNCIPMYDDADARRDLCRNVAEGQICRNISDILFSTKLKNHYQTQSFREPYLSNISI